MKPADDAASQAVFSGWPLFYTTYASCAGLMYRFLPLSSFIVASLALTWLFYRLRQVLKRPVDELVQLLGLDVPSSPAVSLLEINPTSVAIHWKPSDNRNSIDKYGIRVNGTIVNEVSAQETSVKVLGLKADSYYTIRVVAINAANFQAHSDPVRVKTTEGSSNPSTPDTPTGASAPAKITIAPYRAIVEPISINSSFPGMREQPGNHLQAKRLSGGRRPSPAPGSKTLGGEGMERSTSSVDKEQEMKALTEKLDSLSQDIQKLKREDEEDEIDFQKQRALLLEQRETKKQKLKEREDQSKDLKKTVASLEHRDTAAKNKQAQQARIHDEKVREREKMQEDVKRWQQRSIEIEAEIVSLIRDKNEYSQSARAQIEDIRAEQSKEEDIVKGLEEQLRVSKIALRDLEARKKSLDVEQEGESDLAKQQREDSEWAEKLRKLQLLLNQAVTERTQSHAHLQQVEYNFQAMQGRRGSQPSAFPFAHDGSMSHGDLPSTAAPEPAPTFVPSSYMSGISPGNMTIQPLRTGSAIPSRPSSTTFGSIGAIGAPPSRLPQERPLSGIDFRRLNSADAISSPIADSLLPSDLLGDDNEESDGVVGIPNSASGGRAPGNPPLSALGRSSAMGSRDVLPGLGNIPGLGLSDTTQTIGQGPTSPVSVLDSPSPSSISSPHGSFANIHQNRGSDTNIDSDRRSVRSMSGSSRRPKGSKFFSSTRIRGKTTSDEPPVLGTLSKSESRSMPRENNSPVARRRLGGGGLFGMSSSVNPFGAMFGSKSSALARTSAMERPQSMLNATDASLSRLGESASLGWASANDLSAPRSNSILGGHTGLHSRSHYSSRRQSLIGDDGSDLPSDINEDSQELIEEETIAPQAPIGTKPKKRGSSQLNPKATDFQTRAWFTLGGKGDKVTPKSKHKEKTPVPEEQRFSEDGSPLEPRQSRDALSVSAEGSFESLDVTHTENATSAHSTPRESFIRKISRKGNSSIRLPTLKDKLSRTKTNPQSDETDEDNLGKSVDSVTSSPAIGSEKGTSTTEKRSSGFSLDFFSSKSRRKKGIEASSVSEASMASTASADNVDEDDEEEGSKVE